MSLETSDVLYEDIADVRPDQHALDWILCGVMVCDKGVENAGGWMEVKTAMQRLTAVRNGSVLSSS